MWLLQAAFALDPGKTISQYVHDQWDSENGLLGGSIYAICQSPDGYLWIGTQRGLVRFDGYHFTLIQQPIPNMPPLGPVLGLATDAQGNLWIRLEGPRLLRYRSGKFVDVSERLHWDESTFTAMSNDDESGVLLAGVRMHVLDDRDGKFEPVPNTGELADTVISVAQTRDHNIWLGTRDSGLFRMTNGHPVSVSSALAGTKINVLLSAYSGGLWIGTDHGLRYWDGSGLAQLALLPAIDQLQILAMTVDRNSNTWVGTNHGLLRISPANIASLALLQKGDGNEVSSIYQDHDGSIWFGGTRGLERLRDGIFTSYTKAQGLPSDSNGPVYVDAQNRTWFAPLAGGLYWIRNDHVHPITVAGLPNDVVYSISGGGGKIWVGRQHGGLTVLTQSGDSFTARTYTQTDGLAQDSVYSVHRNRDGTVWAGTVSGGVSRLRDGVFTNFTTANGLSSNTINSIVEGDVGTMWFATPSGLDSFQHGQWKNYFVSNGLPSSNIGTLFQDSQHALWIATAEGLASLSSGRIKTLQYLPEPLKENIYGIAEGKPGILWLVTSDHVLQVNRNQLWKDSLAATDIRSYGIEDGLRGVEGVRRDRSMIAAGNGNIWISLNHGLSVAYPSPTIDSALPVKARIDSVQVGGKDVDFRKALKIPPDGRSITFHFAGTSLSNLDRIRFRYKLEGFDRDWSNAAASHQIVYTNLAPGTYRFRIVASNGLDLWNGPETDIAFTVAPASWQTWWFRALVILALMLLVLAVYRLRMYQMTRTMNMRFQERLAERTRIAQDLHDTLLQGVLSASLQLDVADEQLPEDSPTKPLVRRVLQLMSRVSEEGRHTLRGLRTPEANSSTLEIAFSRIRNEFAVDEGIDYRVVANATARPVRPMIRDEVYRVGREALVNAFVHARASSIEVEVEYANRYLRVLVRDDGCGIDSQVLQSGRAEHWGLPGMRERAGKMGANLKLRSRPGMGTEVEMTVPGAIAYEGGAQGLMQRWFQRRRSSKSSAIDRKK